MVFEIFDRNHDTTTVNSAASTSNTAVLPVSCSSLPIEEN